jgi:hypothetical protein
MLIGMQPFQLNDGHLPVLLLVQVFFLLVELDCIYRLRFKCKSTARRAPTIKNGKIMNKKTKNIRMYQTSITGLLSICMVFLFCTQPYNPFTDYENAGISIEHQTFFSGDTIEVFSTQSIQVIVTAKAMLDSFRISASGNRLWNKSDSLVKSQDFSKEPFTFSFSFYDSLQHQIFLTSFRTNGQSVSETLMVFARVPLGQDDIHCFDGQRITLKTTPVQDAGTGYYWSLGAGSVYFSPICSVSVIVHAAKTSGMGAVWVSDGTWHSPADSFWYALVDTLSPVIQCVNEGNFLSDTIIIGDTLFNFKLQITDGSDGAVDSASIDGKVFDRRDRSIFFYKLFERMDRYTLANPLRVSVYAKDRFENGNSIIRVYWIAFSDTVTPSALAKIVIESPSVDSLSVDAAMFHIAGRIENNRLDSVDCELKAYVNDSLQSSILRVTELNPNWEWDIPLAAGINSVRLVATKYGTAIEAATQVFIIQRQPGAPDIVGPTIFEITADGQNATGYYTSKAKVKIGTRLSDPSGVDSVYINTMPISVSSLTQSWFYDSVTLTHVPQGNEVTVRTFDRLGNSSVKSVVVFRNRTTVYQKRPASARIETDTLWHDSVSAVDPDGDSLSFAKVSGPVGLNVRINGGIDWTPASSDTGLHKVTIRVSDGYQPQFYTFSLSVYPKGGIPPTPVKFAIKSTEFPQYLEVGHDSLYLQLRVVLQTGFKPFAYSARILNPSQILLDSSIDSVLRWKPTLSDTGYRQMIITIKDDFPSSDTLYSAVLVVPPNRPCSLDVTFKSDTLSSGGVNVNARQNSDTLVFHIFDPDDPRTERHHISIYQARTGMTSIVDSAVTDTFTVVVNPRSIDGWDTVIVTVTDKANNTTTLRTPVYYGVPPQAATLALPVNEATVGSVSPILSWTGSDTDNDVLTYDVYVGTNSLSMTLVATTSAQSATLSGLSASTAYFWKIVSRDWKSSTTSLTRRFYTP